MSGPATYSIIIKQAYVSIQAEYILVSVILNLSGNVRISHEHRFGD